MNVTVGYPSIKTIDLAISTSQIVSTITSEKCKNCKVPATFDNGRYIDLLNYISTVAEYFGNDGNMYSVTLNGHSEVT